MTRKRAKASGGGEGPRPRARTWDVENVFCVPILHMLFVWPLLGLFLAGLATPFHPLKNGPGRLLLHMLTVGPLLVLFVVVYLHHDSNSLPLAMPFVLVALVLVGPFLLALVGTTGFFALRALALAFRGELATFGRHEAATRSEHASPKKDGA